MATCSEFRVVGSSTVEKLQLTVARQYGASWHGGNQRQLGWTTIPVRNTRLGAACRPRLEARACKTLQGPGPESRPPVKRSHSGRRHKVIVTNPARP